MNLRSPSVRPFHRSSGLYRTSRSLVFISSFVWLFVSACSYDPIQNTQQAIIGGQEDLSHPAVGVLTTDTFTPFCTATLIAPRLALTAAHCIDIANYYKIDLRFRIDIPSKSSVGFNQHYIDVEKTSIHPGWSSQAPLPTNDLALLHFAESIPMIEPVTIYTETLDDSWKQKQITAIGYGLVQTRPTLEQATKKHSLSLPITEILSDSFRVFVQDKSPCSGDSGGPALFEIGGKVHTIGVASYVTGTQVTPYQPACDGTTVYMRLDTYKDWLLPFLSQPQGDCKQDADCTTPQRCYNHQRFEEPCANDGERCVCLTPGKLEEKSQCSFAQRCGEGLSCQLNEDEVQQTCKPAGCGCQETPSPSEPLLYLLLLTTLLVWRRKHA
ncbi:MAG: S1 family peptidase [Myxococcales bacterium]|nr:S1 family peptidase [Myxococcales bacterium]